MKIINANTKQPLVSVIMPTYNYAQFIGEAIDSVLNQTYKNFELIIIDNYSNDNTEKIVKSFNDNRIKYFKFNNNGIIAASRNMGVKHSEGELIAFLDSDDKWYSTKLTRCIQVLKSTVDIVFHGLRFIKNGILWRETKARNNKRVQYSNLLFKGCCLTTSSVVVRKQWLLKVGCFRENPDFVTVEDYDLWLRLAKEGAQFHPINEILGEYNLHNTNASQSVICHMNANIAVVTDHFKTMGTMGTVTYWKRLKMKQCLAMIIYGAARNFQRNGDRGSALYYYGKSIAVYPFIARVYAGVISNVLHF